MRTFFQRLKWILTLRCEEASRLMSDAQDRKLRWFEWLALKGHLLACRVCPAVNRQFQLITRASQEGRRQMNASRKASLKTRLWHERSTLGVTDLVKDPSGPDV